MRVRADPNPNPNPHPHPNPSPHPNPNPNPNPNPDPDQVHDVVAFSVPHDELGEVVGVAVVLHPGRVTSLDELQANPEPNPNLL